MKARLAIFVSAALGAMVLAGTATPAASTSTDNEFVPFSLTAVGCGDVIEVTGTLHVLLHVTINDAGGITIKEHFQPQGATGVGLVSGATYQATGVTQDTQTDNGPGPQFETTFVNNFRMISHGTTANYDVHETFHVTVNNNGEITASHDSFSEECQG